jgi:hypothetical protein
MRASDILQVRATTAVMCSHGRLLRFDSLISRMIPVELNGGHSRNRHSDTSND